MRFCVGDRFYLCENKILCEYDYEERLVFATMALNPPLTATLAHLKRQVTHLQPQTPTAGGSQRQSNGGTGSGTVMNGAVAESAPSHNGYPGVPTSSSSHTSLGSLATLNGIGGPQSTGYEAK